MWVWWRASESGGGADRGVDRADAHGDVGVVAVVSEVGAVSGDVRAAQAAAAARAYLGLDPEVFEAIRARREYQSLLLEVSAEVRDHAVAGVVSAVRSVLDPRLTVVTAQRDELVARLVKVTDELAELQALWAAG